MIKMIVSDLDGTLLQNGSQALEKETIPLIKSLLDKGIYFVSASGRQYYNQKKLYHDLWNRIIFICENGALTVENDKVIHEIAMNQEIARAIAKDILGCDGCEVTINAHNTAYLMPKKEDIVHHMRDIVGYHVTIIKDLNEITEDILKLAVYDPKGIHNSEAYFTGKWSNQVKTAVSGLEWLDFTDVSANKGNALKALQKRLHILPEETMVFGDNYNDIEMLSCAKYSYAMKHANSDIKVRANFETDRVERILEKLQNTME